MKDILIGILFGVLLVLAIQYFSELKRLDQTKTNKQKIINVEFDGTDNFSALRYL